VLYRLIRILPYQQGSAQACELETWLSQGWKLFGSPFTAKPDEYFQAVIRLATPDEQKGGPGAQVALKEVTGTGGSLSHG
jgi:hypothetical protein